MPMERNLTRHARVLAHGAIWAAMDDEGIVGVEHFFTAFRVSPAPHAAALLRTRARDIRRIFPPDLPLNEEFANVLPTYGINIPYSSLCWQLFIGAAGIATACNRLQIATGDLLGSLADLPYPVYPGFLTSLGFEPGTGTRFVTEFPDELGGETQDLFIH